MEEQPPIRFFKLLEFKTYFKSNTKWICLCVVESPHGNRQIRLYKYTKRNRFVSEQWKIALFNSSVRDINLGQITLDAIQFARRYSVELRWDKLREGEAERPFESSQALAREVPSCPICGTAAFVARTLDDGIWHCGNPVAHRSSFHFRVCPSRLRS
jgi:ribosomal protein S27AE